jgi:transposase
MEILYERCAGLDVHKKTVQVCCVTPDEEQRRRKEHRHVSTKTADVLQLRDWLKERGVTHIAMESTGVYWKPIYNLLEGDFAILVVNAQHIKQVPGRKTDVKDAEWIADLLQHGLLKASFIPAAPQRELRDLTRHRTSLIEERTRVINRLQKTLEDATIKVGDVVSDIMGKAARMILHALQQGEEDPKRLAALAQGRVRASEEDLVRALEGRVTAHHRFMLGEHLRHIEEVEAAIGRVTEELARRFTPPEPPAEPESCEPKPSEEGRAGEGQEATTQEQAQLSWQEAVQRIDSVLGINERAAQGILAETGVQMGQFPSAKHFASWAGVCPGHNESAGKRRSGKTRQGNPHLRRLFIQAAHAAAHSKNSYLAAQYRRIARRRGPKRTAMAVAHSIAVIIYPILRDHTTYQDLGGNYFDERDRQAIEKRLVRRLQRLGYQVELQPVLQTS